MVEKTLSRRLGVAIVLVVACSMLMAVPVLAQQFHGASVQKTVLGPGGAAEAREGDTVTAYIRVTNTDDFGDALNITWISDVVHHASGDIPTGNLLGAPVILANQGDYVDVSHSYIVEVGDNDPLGDTATCIGIDPVVGEFTLTFPGQIDILSVEVGGSALPVSKLNLLAPWLVLTGCLGGLALLALRKKRQA